MAQRRVHVAVGVIHREIEGERQILIAKRLDHLHQGGLWEFPGGKVEVGETVEQALARELKEELSIEATAFRALLNLEHDYVDKMVRLDVHWVDTFSGEAEGCEGQQLRWVPVSGLAAYDFPQANKPILAAVIAA